MVIHAIHRNDIRLLAGWIFEQEDDAIYRTDESQCFEETGGASSDLPLLPQVLRVQSNELLELYILRP